MAPTSTATASPTAAARPNQVLVTPDDHGPILAVAAIFCVVIAVMTAIFRLATRWMMRRMLARDDIFIIGAALFHVAQTISLCLGVKDGSLGTRPRLLSPSRCRISDKAVYAADLFYVPALACGKVSSLDLMRRVAVKPVHQFIAQGTLVTSGLWGFAEMWPLLFRCKVPRVWELGGNCINEEAYWSAFTAIDIVVDLVIVILPFFMLRSVHVNMPKKIAIICAFSCRICVIAVSAIRLYYIILFSRTPTAPTLVNTQLLSTVVLVLSTMTACIPCLKPFLDSFASGMFDVTVGRTSFDLTRYPRKSNRETYPLSSRPAARERRRNHRARYYTGGGGGACGVRDGGGGGGGGASHSPSAGGAERKNQQQQHSSPGYIRRFDSPASSLRGHSATPSPRGGTTHVCADLDIEKMYEDEPSRLVYMAEAFAQSDPPLQSPQCSSSRIGSWPSRGRVPSSSAPSGDEIVVTKEYEVEETISETRTEKTRATSAADD